MPYNRKINLLDTLTKTAQQKVKSHNQIDLTKLATSDIKKKRKTYQVHWENTLMLIDKNYDQSKYGTIVFDVYQGLIAVEATTNQLIRKSVPRTCAINQIIQLYANFHNHFEYLPFIVGQTIFFPLPKKEKDHLNQTWISTNHINREYVYSIEQHQAEIWFNQASYYFKISASENYVHKRLECCYQIQKMIHSVKANFANSDQDYLIHANDNCYSISEALKKCMEINEEKVVKKLIKKYPNEKLNHDLLKAYQLDAKES
ncbi:hypothetical protein GSH19_03505 [Lactobacillus sp. S2-2]|uniref:hypothetical protein n=1 Tax=Lactobacillus sp. S2-2 TaxID=2692917 RepID=UPI001F38C435|nr:hypothetical protein [Lactobacillus sp. S2-2]MCF6515220.1 hypothetical protein [Lactobacillus sp. S2-2]